jgi:tetratricopeptide (TPR) repeat protein
MLMKFILDHIEEIRSGGMPVLQRKIRIFPWWFLWWFGTNKYRIKVAYPGCRVAVTLKPDWAEAQALLAFYLIKLERFDEAMAAWKQAFLLKPGLRVSYNQIQWAFYVCGQIQEAWGVAQGIIDAQNSFANKHQLNKLGIRFLKEFSTHIGHIALIDSYVKMGILGQRYAATPIILAAKPANLCYLDYWRPFLPVIITNPREVESLSPISDYLEDRVGSVMNLSGAQPYSYYPVERAIQAQWEAEGRGHLLTLTESDRLRGENCLRSLGVPADAWFVGMHVREGDRKENRARDSDISTWTR